MFNIVHTFKHSEGEPDLFDGVRVLYISIHVFVYIVQAWSCVADDCTEVQVLQAAPNLMALILKSTLKTYFIPFEPTLHPASWHSF